MAKVRQITKRTGPDQAPDQLLHRVNAVLRGWCAYFRHGVSAATFGYLRHYAYWRMVGWLRRTYLKERWPSHAQAWTCSTRSRCASSATATAAHGSRSRGHAT